MAIDFKALAANNTNNAAATKSNAAATKSKAADDRPKAQLWLNIGYDVQVEVRDPETGVMHAETRFISLPVGIPLDTMDKLPTNSSNQEFAALQAARNSLLDQLIAKASSVSPGESVNINLQVNLRRVRDEAAPIAAAENPFVRTLML